MPPGSPSLPAFGAFPVALLWAALALLPGAARAQDVPEVAPPLPAFTGGVAAELSSLSQLSPDAEPSDVIPRLATSQRIVLRAPVVVGADLILAPQTGTASWAQLTVGVARRMAFPHPYGVAASRETRYKDSYTLGGPPRGVEDPIHAYQVVEGGEAVGQTVDLRAFGLHAGPRVSLDPTTDAPLDLGVWAGVVGIYQRAPGWVDEAGEVGDKVAPESSWVLEAGALYQSGRLWGEVELSGSGGPAIVGFTRRRLYGRIGARASADAVEVSLGIGVGVQVNRDMRVLPGAPVDPPPALDPADPMDAPAPP